MNMHIPSRQNIFREMRDYLMIALGMIMYGIGWTVFLLPSDIPSGAVPGIASIIYWGTGFPVQYTYLIINFLLLLLALKILGLKFCLKTIFAVFTLTFILSVIQNFVTGELIHDQPFMSCVLGASFCGAGFGVAFSANGSTGGTDIIAAIINKYRDITLGRVILICDVIIISSSYLVLHYWEKVVYGYVVLFISSFVLDQVVESGGGKNGYVEGYRVGGKTATSQTLPRGTGRYIASFLGFAPADDPQVKAIAKINTPQGTCDGGQIAATVIRQLKENLLPYLEEKGYTESCNDRQ